MRHYLQDFPQELNKNDKKSENEALKKDKLCYHKMILLTAN